MLGQMDAIRNVKPSSTYFEGNIEVFLESGRGGGGDES